MAGKIEETRPSGKKMIKCGTDRCIQVSLFFLVGLLGDFCGKNPPQGQEENRSVQGFIEPTLNSATTMTQPVVQQAGTGMGCYDIGNIAETGSVQTASRSTPSGSGQIIWQNPSIYTSIASFRGSNNRPAAHEGTDFVHSNASTAPTVYIKAPADGIVVYCQKGCLQSTEIGSNTSARECGQGWGNHLVIRHGNGTSIPFTYTRLAHLKPGSLLVDFGQTVLRGQTIAVMGNSGRSDTRHVHIELGTRASDFTPGVKSQNFDRVWNFELLSRSAAANVQ